MYSYKTCGIISCTVPVGHPSKVEFREFHLFVDLYWFIHVSPLEDDVPCSVSIWGKTLSENINVPFNNEAKICHMTSVTSDNCYI